MFNVRFGWNSLEGVCAQCYWTFFERRYIRHREGRTFRRSVKKIIFTRYRRKVWYYKKTESVLCHGVHHMQFCCTNLHYKVTLRKICFLIPSNVKKASNQINCGVTFTKKENRKRQTQKVNDICNLCSPLSYDIYIYIYICIPMWEG